MTAERKAHAPISTGGHFCSNVAQTSSLLYRRFPTCGSCDNPPAGDHSQRIPFPSGLPIGNRRYSRLGNLRYETDGPRPAFALRYLLFVLVLFALAAPTVAADKFVPAKLKVSGYGILGDLELKRILRTLELSGKKPEWFGPAFIEDSALILSARVKRDGYLKPNITIRMTLRDGSRKETTAGALVDSPLPRTLLATRVEFRIHKGVLYHYQQLEFQGLETMSDKQARSYFMETASLLHPQSARVYTPEKLKHGISSLIDVLQRDGYESARAVTNHFVQNDRKGHVYVKIAVTQGPKSVVESVQEHFLYTNAVAAAGAATNSATNATAIAATNSAPSKVAATTGFESTTNSTNPLPHDVLVRPNKPYSQVWAQDFSQSLKTNLFHRGYPDTSVEIKTVRREQTNNTVRLDLEAIVTSGPFVRIGVVDFAGEKRTKETTMAKRVRIKRGEPLDRIKAEEGRYRLAQLGSFDTVDLTYQPIDEHTRDVLYRVKEGKHLEVSLLFGYGSYELLRGGVEVQENNIWGLGHHADIKGIQSFKASSGEFTYTIPDIFVGKDIDLFFNGTGLRREEIDFTRVEYGGGFGAHRFFKEQSTDATIRYSYQILNANEVPGIAVAEGPTNTAVGAIITDLKHDRRDNPLYPTKGYKVFVNYELASQYLGGEVNYQRVEASTSFHQPLGGGRVLSLGVTHGFILAMGDPSKDIPFNRRFFPGGENSIRGYREGEASPKDAEGKIVGAETATVGTVEFEQALTPKWSFVLFSDSLGFAEHASHYPFDTGLFSVGGGLRLKTIIGPARLEYGYNLNPRKSDPVGTLQFSLGYPF